MGRVVNHLEDPASAAATQILSRAAKESRIKTIPLENSAFSLRLEATPKGDALPPAVGIEFTTTGMRIRFVRVSSHGTTSKLIDLRQQEHQWIIATRTKGTKRTTIQKCILDANKRITSGKFIFGSAEVHFPQKYFPV